MTNFGRFLTFGKYSVIKQIVIVVTDVVIETASGDVRFEYNIVLGGVQDDVSRNIVAEYAKSADCIWLDLAVTVGRL